MRNADCEAPMRPSRPLVSQGCAVLTVGILAALSWRWVYEPAARAYARDDSRVATLTDRIARWEAVVGASGGEAGWLSRNQQRLAQLRDRFPQQAQLPQALNALVDALKAGELKLLNVTQGNVEPVQEAGKPLLINGMACFRLPITVTAEGRYQAILEAMERITSESFPAVVSLGQAELHLMDAAGPKLNAAIQLSLYVTGPVTIAPPDA